MLQQIIPSLWCIFNDPDGTLYRESIAEALQQHLQLIHLSIQSSNQQQPDFPRLESFIRANLDQKLTVAELARDSTDDSTILTANRAEAIWSVGVRVGDNTPIGAIA